MNVWRKLYINININEEINYLSIYYNLRGLKKQRKDYLTSIN